MCGIAGALSVRSATDLETVVREIVASQIARGPDVQKCLAYRDERGEVVLGHDRLSIIDLRAEADQPMAGTAEESVLVYNGEIYNYLELRADLERAGVVFRTRSDTEVILAAYREWGDAAFERFLGMFAFALFDRRRGELLLVRDRFGVKPLFYWTDGAVFVFASTPTVIAKWASLAPNLEYVSRGIRFKYYEDDLGTAPYRGVAALEPSHALRVSRGGATLQLTKWRYYDIRERAAALVDRLARASDASLLEELTSLLSDATRIRLRADVPMGLSVSGGIDSGAIAALVSGMGQPVAGYCFGHPSDASSEAPLVEDLARHTNVDPRWVQVGSSQEICDLFWQTLRAQDAPFPHVSIMAQFAVFRAARANGTLVLLGGQGGDEAFMGYRKFMLFYAQSILRGRDLRAIPRLLSTVLPLVPAVAARSRVFIAERRRYSSDAGMRSPISFAESASGSSMGMSRGTTLFERQVLDVTRYSLPTLLRYEDRNSMGNSVESRLPFLDHRVIEFGLALDARVKLGRGFGKHILRRALAGRIPDSIRLNRDKRGFDVNQNTWIRAGLGAELRDAIRSRAAVLQELLPRHERTDLLFSDDRLTTEPQAFNEAVSLIWLGDRL